MCIDSDKNTVLLSGFGYEYLIIVYLSRDLKCSPTFCVHAISVYDLWLDVVSAVNARSCDFLLFDFYLHRSVVVRLLHSSISSLWLHNQRGAL